MMRSGKALPHHPLAGRLARLLGDLGEFLDHHVAFQLRDMIDEQRAVEVIDLVLQAGGQYAGCLQKLFLAIAVDVFDGATGRAFHIGIIFRNGKTTFLIDRRLIGKTDNFRIDQENRIGNRRWLFFSSASSSATSTSSSSSARLAAIDGDHPQRHANLDTGKANARRVIHRLQHVIEQLAHFIIHPLNRF